MFNDIAENELALKPPPELPAKKSGPGRTWGTLNKSYCGVLNCSSCTVTCPNLWFFKLPMHTTEPQRRQKWLEQIGQADVQTYQRLLVCEKHFDSSDICANPRFKSKKILYKDAVPTLLLPPPQAGPKIRTKARHVYQKMNTSDNKVYTQTNTKVSNVKPITTNKQARTVSDNKIELPQLSSLCNTLGNKTLDTFNMLYLKLKENAESIINSDQYKQKILQLYYGNPQTYEVLQSTLCLPPISTLPSFIPTTSEGICQNCINCLKSRNSYMSSSQKLGILCVNITRIKRHVNYDYRLDTITGVSAGTNILAPVQYAVVAMARGLTSDWHQIVSIYFIAALSMFKEFNTWLDNLIVDLMQIGINIKAVVTNTDDFFINAFALRKMHHVIQIFNFCKLHEKRVFHIYDPLHIMLLLYDELKNIIVTHGKNSYAKWEHISKFFELDNTRPFRLTHRSSPVNPEDVQQNKLKSAAQILGLSTASGIATFVDLQLLDKNAMGTVDFLVRINEILILLYPDALQPEYQHLITQEGGDCFWEKNIAFLRSAAGTNLNNDQGAQLKSEVKFLKCFITSMENVLYMLEELSLKEHAPVLTRYLNQDPLVEFIDKIHLKFAKLSTANEFLEIIKGDLMLNNFKLMQGQENSIGMNNFIENASSIIEILSSTELMTKTLNTPIFDNYDNDYTQLESEHAKSIFYVATYLLDKMYQKYKNAVSTRIRFMNSSVYYENQEEGLSGSVIVPDNDFLEFVHNMDVIFVDYCKKAIKSGRLFEELMKQMGKFIVTIPIDIAPLEYIIRLFVELRIYHTIKYNNDVYEKDDKDDQQFLVCRLSSLGVNLEINKRVSGLNFW